MRTRLPLILVATLLLPACVGGSLRNHSELEPLPLREATKEEGQRLKRCLKAARYYQELRKEKVGAPYSRAAEIPHKKYCGDIKLSLNQDQGGYEVIAELKDDDNTVRWSIHENGVMEEHLDPVYNEDLDF